MPEAVMSSSVVEFYNDAKIFITGGTGFLGKALIEKLFRVCPKIDHIYMLVRIKKGKDPQTRMKEVFDDPLFKNLRAQKPDFENKITCIPGDVSSVRLAMSDSDYEFLTNEVTHVFHSAATVRFNEHLKSAIGINVLGTQEMVQFCNKCIRLKIFVHVSTAYSNCVRPEIDEVFYDSPISAEKALSLIDTLSEEKLISVTPELIKPWPNTYCYTKAIAESIVKEHAKSFPALVFRPSIIMGTMQEPVKGWIDNIYGPTGVIVAVGVGLMRVIYANGDSLANIVPVDLTVNAMISAAWEIGSNFNNNAVFENSLTESQQSGKNVELEPKVYNFSIDKNCAISWNQFLQLNLEIGVNVPSTRAIWYYSITVTKFKLLYLFLILLLHNIPAVLVDGVLVLSGKKPQMRKAYQKLHGFIDLLNVFANSNWNFRDQNIKKLWSRLNEKDKELFNFDMGNINWHSYLTGVIHGIRNYLLHETENSLPAARRKMFFFWLGHRIMQFSLVAFFFWILSKFLFPHDDFKMHLKDTILMSQGTLRNST